MDRIVNKRAGIEWLTLAFTTGWQDGEASRRAKRGKTIAREIIGPAYGPNDAEMLRRVYAFGYGCGAPERAEEESDD